MTAEHLHDALSLLPSDLITATDKVRTQPRKTVIHWRRWVSMAACIVLILGCSMVFAKKILPGMGGSTMEAAMEYESAADCAPEAPAAMAPKDSPAAGIVTDESVLQMPECEENSTATNRATEILACEFFHTPTLSADTGATSEIVVIRSRAELEAYWETYADLYDFAAMQSGCGSYDDAWFETKDMLLLPVLGQSADTEWEITHFVQLGENGWEWAISYAFHTITESEDENTGFHLLTDVQKGLISEDDDILTVADTVNSTVNGEPFNE